MVRLYITRHGETVWNVQRRMQGQKNSELTDRGRQQAALLSKTLEDVEFETAYSSSSERALQTSRIIVGEQKHSDNTGQFEKINFGKWEGMNACDVEKGYPEQYKLLGVPHLYEPVGGESFDDIINRLGEVLEMLTNRHKKGTYWL